MYCSKYATCLINPLSTLGRLLLVSIEEVKFQVTPSLLCGATMRAGQLEAKMELHMDEHWGALVTRLPANLAHIPPLTSIVFVDSHVGLNFFRNFFICQSVNQGSCC